MASSKRSPVPVSASSQGSWTDIGLGGTLVVAVCLAYLPAWHGGFIWNDKDYVTRAALQPFHGLFRIWFELGATEQYYPLLHSFFWLQHQLWGDAPTGYHLTALALHATAALLLVSTLKRLAIPGAWLAGFLFALHPVCVESVAWISEQKNTLSLVLYLTAAWLYLRFDETRRPRWYALASFVFALSLLSKTTVATLPAALLLMFWWKRGKLDFHRDLKPLTPWLLLGAGWGLFSAWVERHYVGAHGAEFTLSFLERFLLAGRMIWFYVGKLLWPADLIFIYPRWNIDSSQAWQYVFPTLTLLTLAALWYFRRYTRGLLTAALFFGGSLFPVMGFFNVYGFIYSYVADHWQYLPSIGLITAFAVGVTRLLHSSPPWLRRGLPFSLVSLLAFLSWKQSHLYTDIETFYRLTLQKNPDCWMAHNNLGNLLRDTGRGQDAIVHFNETLRLKPDSPKAYNNLGNVYWDRRQRDEAIRFYARAVELGPNEAEYHNHLATALQEVGRLQEALPHHRRALELFPEFSAAHNSYGMTLRALNRLPEAVEHFLLAVRYNPVSSPAHLNLALSYSLMGKDREAREHYDEARRLNPAIPELK